MWATEKIEEIEDYIVQSSFYNQNRLVAVISGNITSPKFQEKVSHVLPDYNYMSEGKMDFFWLGSSQSREKIGDDFEISGRTFKSSIRVRELKILSKRLKKDAFDLLDSITIVIIPVFSKRLSYEDAVIISFPEELSTTEVTKVFRYLIEKSEEGRGFGQNSIKRDIELLNGGSEDVGMQDMKGVLKQIAADASSGVIASTVFAIMTSIKG